MDNKNIKSANESNLDGYLIKVPILGYFFRKIKENRQAIETALKIGKKTKGKIRKRHFLSGIIKLISSWTFNTLKKK